MQFLDRLRAKPSHVRTRYALGGSLAFTMLIAIVWFTTLPAQFAEIGNMVPEEALKEQTASVENSFDSLFNDIQNAPSEQEAPPVDPEVEQLKTNALERMDEWNGETKRITTSLDSTTTATSSTENEVQTTKSDPRKENIILIGTTTKKSD